MPNEEENIKLGSNPQPSLKVPIMKKAQTYGTSTNIVYGRSKGNFWTIDTDFVHKLTLQDKVLIICVWTDFILFTVLAIALMILEFINA